jgi:hypothetical protein
MLLHSLCSWCIVLAVLLATYVSAQHAPTVTLPNGSKIQGFQQDNVHKFFNVPFGEDTSGANRFQPPVPKRPWSGILNATALGPACPQNGFTFVSEDCLSYATCIDSLPRASMGAWTLSEHR